MGIRHRPADVRVFGHSIRGPEHAIRERGCILRGSSGCEKVDSPKTAEEAGLH